MVAGVAPVALGQGAPAAQVNAFPAPGTERRPRGVAAHVPRRAAGALGDHHGDRLGHRRPRRRSCARTPTATARASSPPRGSGPASGSPSRPTSTSRAGWTATTRSGSPRRPSPRAGQRRHAAASHAAARGRRPLPLAARPPGPRRAHHAAREGRRPRADPARSVLPQGQPEARRAADRRQPRRARVVQAAAARHGGHRPQGPAPGRPARAHVVGGALRRRLGLRRPTRWSTPTTASSRRSRPATATSPTFTTWSSPTAGRRSLLTYDRVKRDLRFAGGERHGSGARQRRAGDRPRDRAGRVRVAQPRQGRRWRRASRGPTAATRGTTSTSTRSSPTRMAT